MSKTKSQPEEAEPSEDDQYKMVRQYGSSKRLSLTKHSKDKDKKRRKKEKKKKLKEEFEQREKDELQNSAQVHTRRRFENQSGKRDAEDLSGGLTRIQYNKIKVLEAREVETLIEESKTTYYQRQKKYNEACQKDTETSEMPCLVMSKFK